MGFFLTLALFAATFILSEVLKPKPNIENARPAALGDFQFPTATEGRVIPIIWGTVKLNGPNVTWYGDLRQRAITEKVKTGLFSSSTITKGYKYDLGMQLSLCRGEVDEILRIWIGDDEVVSGNFTAGDTITIDQPTLFGGDDLGNGGVTGSLTMFSGTEVQTASPYLEDFQAEGGDTPAYRGTCYLAPVDAPIYVGNSTSIKPWAIEARRLPTNAEGTQTRSVNSGADANPAYVLLEILTNDEWGLGFAPADIDTDAFDDAATTLQTEGNGFSFVLDSVREIEALVEEVQRQIDGVVFLDQQTGLWTLLLARAGSTNLGNVTEANIIEVRDFSRGAWEDTTNYVTTPFSDRSRDYFDTYGLAQDMANQRIQQAVVKANISFPGCKDPTLANQLAWRELRSLTFPLAKATLIVNREFWNARPTNLVTWTSAALGITNLVMRISRVDLGQIDQGEIALDVVQDVFATVTPSFGDPVPTGWTPPTNIVTAVPADEQQIFEAPLAFSIRDPDPLTNAVPFRVWAAARNQNDGSAEFDLRTSTGGTLSVDRTSSGFMLTGTLVSTLEEATTSTTITVNPSPDTLSAWLDAITSATANEVGDDLTNLLLIGNEFIAFRDAIEVGGNVQLTTCYRGVLDSAPALHGAASNVYLLSAGGVIGSLGYANGNSITSRIIPRSVSNELLESSANAVVVVMNNRHLRPYPPVGFDPQGLGAYTSTTVSLDVGSLDNAGIIVSYDRRDYLEFRENARHQSGDAAPSNTTTVYRARVFDTSSGTTELFVTAYNGGGNSVKADRSTILRHTGGTIPTSMRIDIETQHTIDAVTYDALQDMSYTFDTQDNSLSPDFNLGVLGPSVTSSQWSAPTTGTYNCNVGTANTGGAIEVQINGGGFATVIAASGTSGSFAASATDTIEFRSVGTTLAGRSETILIVDAPSSTADAYAIFTE